MESGDSLKINQEKIKNGLNTEINVKNLIKENQSLQNELKIEKNKKQKDNKKIYLLKQAINNLVSEQDKNIINRDNIADKVLDLLEEEQWIDRLSDIDPKRKPSDKKEQDKINLAGHNKHLKSHTNLYNAWLGIKRRCYNPNDKSYSRWGGRGITVCDEWKNDFMSFYNWSIENGYEDGLTIDRIDNNGNYEPSNCRWASQKEQANNRRSNIDITIGNATKTLKEWCEIFELDYKMVNARYHRSDCRTLDYLFSQCKYRGKQ